MLNSAEVGELDIRKWEVDMNIIIKTDSCWETDFQTDFQTGPAGPTGAEGNRSLSRGPHTHCGTVQSGKMIGRGFTKRRGPGGRGYTLEWLQLNGAALQEAGDSGGGAWWHSRA